MEVRGPVIAAVVVAAILLLAACGGSTEPDAGGQRSVVLVVVDALRADHLGVYGYARPTSPAIDRLAADGRVFERAYATSPWTLPSFGSILTGHWPSAHRAGIEVAERGADVEVAAARNFVTLGDVPTVPEALAAAGYATAAFVTNPFLDPRFGLDRGFADYDHFEASNEELRPASEVVDLGLEWIDGRGGQPFFVLLHMFEPHLDYDARPPYGGMFSDASSGYTLPVRGLWPTRNRIEEIAEPERAFITAAYDEEIAAVDEQIGRLAQELDDRDLWDNALLVLTADHGEELFDHGGFEHGHALYEEVLRVPLVVWGAGVQPGRVAAPVSIADVAPTILEFAGAEVPAGLAGRPLLGAGGEVGDRPVIAERVLYGPEAKAVVRWPYKAVIEADGGATRLYDLAADPRERRDLAAVLPEVVGELAATLAAELETSGQLAAGAEADLDEELVARLRALGYVGGGSASDPDGRIVLLPDEDAFDAPPAPQSVPFDVVTADMELDGDPDLLINWHNLAPLEIFANDGGRFRPVNAPPDDRSGVYENRGIVSVFSESSEMLARLATLEGPAVYVWHDPDRRDGDWHLFVVPADEPVELTLRANQPLTVRAGPADVRHIDEFRARVTVSSRRQIRARAARVATQLVIESSAPLFVGPALHPSGQSADLWKDDPHGTAWLNARGSEEPDIFITRGGLGGDLRPPHDPKVDRLFERSPAAAAVELLYDDLRDLLPPGYGRGRRLEWVDVDGDAVNELYIGNTATPNAMLEVDGSGYRDVAADVGLDFINGDTFAWLDVDDDGRDDLVFVDADGFRIAYNRGARVFDVGAGSDVGLAFPAGSDPVQADPERRFTTLALRVLDYDSDGRLDLWLTGHGEGRGHALYRGIDRGFVDVTAEAGLAAAPLTNELVVADFDNDGYLDALTFGARTTLLHNRRGRFEPSDLDLGLRVFSRGVPVDADLDGRLDVAVVDDARILLRNATPAGSALRVAVGAPGNLPVGTLVSAVYANGMVHSQRLGSAHSTKYSQGSGPLHFGVPADTTLERLIVRWPDGRREERAVAAGEEFIELRR